MAEKLVMLALSPTMEVGTIARWTVSEGTTVVSGQVLCEVQTDKATMEYESMADGTLLKIVVGDGGQAKVGETIAIVGEPGENISGLLASAGAPAPAEASKSASPAAPASAPTPALAPALERSVKSSPLARKIAAREGVDLGALAGSGPAGRIVKRDVEAAVAAGGAKIAPPSPAPPSPVKEAVKADRTVPVSPVRKIIAERLSASMYSAPHYYLKVRVAMDHLMASRQELNARLGEKISVNAFLIKFVAEALKRHPAVNSTWGGDTIAYHGSADVALAVAQPDGLMTPVVRDCGAKGIIAIDRELRDLIEKARKGTLAPPEYTGATFTITNLGSFGIEEFTAIINPPGSAILAVGSIQKAQVFGADGAPAIRSLCAMTLSCDHRTIDGAVGAAFLSELRGTIENPIQALY